MNDTIENNKLIWYKACKPADIPAEGGACIKYKDEQIAIFNFSSKGKWYATQNLCPHKMQMVLSRGMIGDMNGEPKVACPFHKKTFSLESGCNLQGEDYYIKTYPVKVEGEYVYVGFEE